MTVDEERLRATTDAQVWARAFMEEFAGESVGPFGRLDEGTMIGWFANAFVTAEILGPSLGTTFEVGHYYRHTTGRLLLIAGEAETYNWGGTLIGERRDGSLIPVGRSPDNAVNWEEITREEWQASSDAELTGVYPSSPTT